jgi:hypothetical protein
VRVCVCVCVCVFLFEYGTESSLKEDVMIKLGARFRLGARLLVWRVCTQCSAQATMHIMQTYLYVRVDSFYKPWYRPIMADNPVPALDLQNGLLKQTLLYA